MSIGQPAAGSGAQSGGGTVVVVVVVLDAVVVVPDVAVVVLEVVLVVVEVVVVVFDVELLGGWVNSVVDGAADCDDVGEVCGVVAVVGVVAICGVVGVGAGVLLVPGIGEVVPGAARATAGGGGSMVLPWSWCGLVVAMMTAPSRAATAAAPMARSRPSGRSVWVAIMVASRELVSRLASREFASRVLSRAR